MLNIRMDAVRSFGILKFSQCCLQGNFLANFLKQELLRAIGNERLKSANSSSKLSNKGCPLICIKDQTMPIFQQAGGSGPNNQSITVVSYDQTGHRPTCSTTKKFQANFLEQELRVSRECQWKTQICQLLI